MQEAVWPAQGVCRRCNGRSCFFTAGFTTGEFLYFRVAFFFFSLFSFVATLHCDSVLFNVSFHLKGLMTEDKAAWNKRRGVGNPGVFFGSKSVGFDLFLSGHYPAILSAGWPEADRMDRARLAEGIFHKEPICISVASVNWASILCCVLLLCHPCYVERDVELPCSINNGYGQNK